MSASADRTLCGVGAKAQEAMSCRQFPECRKHHLNERLSSAAVSTVEQLITAAVPAAGLQNSELPYRLDIIGIRSVFSDCAPELRPLWLDFDPDGSRVFIGQVLVNPETGVAGAFCHCRRAKICRGLLAFRIRGVCCLRTARNHHAAGCNRKNQPNKFHHPIQFLFVAQGTSFKIIGQAPRNRSGETAQPQSQRRDHRRRTQSRAANQPYRVEVCYVDDADRSDPPRMP